jgi:hypothetical protein
MLRFLGIVVCGDAKLWLCLAVRVRWLLRGFGIALLDASGC